MHTMLGAFVVALAVGLFAGRIYERAIRSRRDYTAGVKAMKTYKTTMNKQVRRAVFILGIIAFCLAAVFIAAMKSAQS